MANDLQVGAVGIGYFGRHYVRLLNTIPGAKLCAVARVSKQYGKEASEFMPEGIRRYDEPAALFADPNIDCVIIATPTPSHATLAVQALAHGKHVLLEKPMARDMQEAELIRAAADKSGRVFMLAHQFLYNDHIRYLKGEIDKGTFGTIRSIFAQHLYSGRIPSGVGCFLETATHELAIIDYLFSPAKLLAARGNMTDLSGNGYDDLASVHLDFEGAPSAQIVVSWLYPEKIRQMAVVGDKGSAVFDGQAWGSLKIYLEGKAHVPSVEVEEPLRKQVLHFIDCVRTGKRPLTGIDHGLRIMSYLDTVAKDVLLTA